MKRVANTHLVYALNFKYGEQCFENDLIINPIPTVGFLLDVYHNQVAKGTIDGQLFIFELPEVSSP